MKKILDFDKKTLERFIVSLTYESEILGIEIEKLALLSERVSEHYPQKPLLGLLKRRPTKIQIGNLIFKDENNINFVEIGQDFLIFTFNQYNKWKRELTKIIKVFEALIDAFVMPNITKIVLTYIDVFKIPIDGFNYNEYFSIPNFENDIGWDIKYHDIFIGIVPYEESLDIEKRKITLRLRSRGIVDNNYVLGLEIVGSVDELSMIPQPYILKEHLDDCHDRTEDYFITFLTQEYRDKLGLEISDDSS